MALQETAFSAFGSTSPIHDVPGDRIRWFCPRLISARNVLLEALDELAAVEGRASASRVTARIVTAGELPPGCEKLLSERDFKTEAKVPMGGPRNLAITYIAKCPPGRRSNANDAQRENELIAGVLAEQRKSRPTIIADFDRLGNFLVQTDVPEQLGSADFKRLVRIHEQAFPTFPYDFSKKLRMMLQNRPSYPLVLVRSVLDGEICAFSNLELNLIELDDGTQLSLAEYDNTMRLASLPDHEDVHGLGRILRLRLALLAARSHVDLCYAESRAGLVAINMNSHQIGMHYGGALQKHVLISGQSNIDYSAPSRFETMNVWYLNREDLATIEVELSSVI